MKVYIEDKYSMISFYSNSKDILEKLAKEFGLSKNEVFKKSHTWPATYTFYIVEGVGFDKNKFNNFITYLELKYHLSIENKKRSK